MSDSSPTPSDRKPDVPPVSSNSRKPKAEGPTLNRVILVVIVVTILLASIYPTVVGRTNVKRLTYSEFEAGLRDSSLNATNVHELQFQLGYLKFQDQPKPKSSESTENYQPKSFEVATATIPDQSLDSLRQLLVEKKIPYDGILPPGNWESWTMLLLMVAPVVLLFMLMMRRIGGAGGALAFGRSRGKLYAEDDTKVTFKDVAGITEAVEELKEVVEFLRSPGKYQALGGRIPRGVLLVGPPGTGKTLLAKAVAGEAGVPFVSLSGSDFVEMFVGVGAARVRDMFQQAAERSPCIIFIDELDALGKARSAGIAGGHEEREQTLNALLVEMDGFGSDQNVIVMGATNRPETLDPALLRPGRFDRHVMVDRPDVTGRKAILEVHSKKIKMDAAVDLSRLAKLTGGFVGADLANLVNEAALLAARKDKKSVTMKDFEEGIERVIAGLEKQTRIIPEEEKRRTAIHECGHALVASSLPQCDPVHKISIIPRGMAAGYVISHPEDDRGNRTRSELIATISMSLGGIAAEQLFYNETSTGVQNDLQRATDMARRMVTEFGMSPKLGRIYFSERRTSVFLGTSTSMEPQHSEDTIREIDLETKRIVEECFNTAFEILQRRRKVLDQMTKELLEVEVMDMEHLKKILDAHYDGPQIVPGTSAVIGTSTAIETPNEGDSVTAVPAT